MSTTVRGFDNNGKPTLLFRENFEPVESTTYQINGIDVSYFVTPTWFVAHSKGPWEFTNQTKAPFQMLSGENEMYSYDNGAKWDQVDMESRKSAMHRSTHSRWALYHKKYDGVKFEVR